MIRGKYCWWFLPVLACLLIACGDDDYHYPSVKLEFLTAFSGATGSLQTVLTDEGESYPVVEDASNMQTELNSFVRIVSNYAPAKTADGTDGVKLYATLNAVAPVPVTADKFEGGVKTDPVELQSIWLGRDYLNLLLGIKMQNGKHLLHFVEDKVVLDETGEHLTVHLTLYHDAGGDVSAYTKRAYASVPLWVYAAEGIRKVTVCFTLNTYSGEQKIREFDYFPDAD